ncbi:MAG: hypothetical protein COZ70_07495 [Deltaproteobacteria bacterium CG_4_8_14_3_um_filter_51_11]|nr:MAG: hypothetical protein AUK25_13570 [Desulfobacteraceae bacterium CG2_30_51_40]PIP45003.1 MAG: hypothetical protein COX16_15565 [Deltaproteobacteria bacterium CG23_combo_of_CG06-09_8_20_14_all_51_20]PIX19712.1 MAG: hypothetical protein COZ70_07495 [Deltaproteobacteria bacterium CG_4_8_14_3_um_filter_51_11]PIY27294.1 MAG: hypothetical protein COZ11_00330 [Deltaproteobacteria bacterium CG_4_10_14_3_um_filter_51_14]
MLQSQDKMIHLHNQNMYAVQFGHFKKRVEDGLSLADIMEEAEKVRIYNSNLGLVWSIDAAEGLFAVLYPDPSGDNRIVIYAFDDFKNIVDLGYALTIHKVQGNQFDYTFIPMINSFYIMLNSKLIYTALTRARKRAVVMGQPMAFKKACQSLDETVRQTFLGLV